MKKKLNARTTILEQMFYRHFLSLTYSIMNIAVCTHITAVYSKSVITTPINISLALTLCRHQSHQTVGTTTKAAACTQVCAIACLSTATY